MKADDKLLSLKQYCNFLDELEKLELTQGTRAYEFQQMAITIVKNYIKSKEKSNG